MSFYRLNMREVDMIITAFYHMLNANTRSCIKRGTGGGGHDKAPIVPYCLQLFTAVA